MKTRDIIAIAAVAFVSTVVIVIVFYAYGMDSLEDFSFEDVKKRYFSDDDELNLTRDLTLSDTCRYKKGYGSDYAKWAGDATCAGVTPDRLKQRYGIEDLRTESMADKPDNVKSTEDDLGTYLSSNGF